MSCGDTVTAGVATGVHITLESSTSATSESEEEEKGARVTTAKPRTGGGCVVWLRKVEQTGGSACSGKGRATAE